MNKKFIPAIIVAAVLVVGGITGVVLANVIGKNDDEPASLVVENTPASLDTSAAQELENLLPEDISQPDIGEDIAPPEINIDTDEDFSDGDFYNYLLNFSLFFHEPLSSVEDLRAISGTSWLTAAFVADYAWSVDFGQGIEYPTDSEGHTLIPITRLSKACEEIFGFPYNFAELSGGDYSYMLVDGNFTVPNGYDMIGVPYADLSTARLVVKDTTITVEVTIVQEEYGEEPAPYGNFRYTFTLDNSQEITPYRLVSIEAI